MATTPKQSSLPAIEAQISNLESGVTTNVPAASSLSVNGTSMAQPAILAKLQSIDALYTGVTDARSALGATIAARKAGEPDAKAFVKALITSIKSQFGVASPLLASFGIALPKPKVVRTAEEKAVSAAKLRNTRAVRGTKGKKQNAAITTSGESGVVVVGPTGATLGTVPPVPPAVVPQAAANAVASGGSASAEAPSKGTTSGA